MSEVSPGPDGANFKAPGNRIPSQARAARRHQDAVNVTENVAGYNHLVHPEEAFTAYDELQTQRAEDADFRDQMGHFLGENDSPTPSGFNPETSADNDHQSDQVRTNTNDAEKASLGDDQEKKSAHHDPSDNDIDVNVGDGPMTHSRGKNYGKNDDGSLKPGERGKMWDSYKNRRTNGGDRNNGQDSAAALDAQGFPAIGERGDMWKNYKNRRNGIVDNPDDPADPTQVLPTVPGEPGGEPISHEEAVGRKIREFISPATRQELATALNDYVNLMTRRERRSFTGPGKAEVEQARQHYEELRKAAKTEILQGMAAAGMSPSELLLVSVLDDGTEIRSLAMAGKFEAEALARPKGFMAEKRAKFLDKWASWGTSEKLITEAGINPKAIFNKGTAKKAGVMFALGLPIGIGVGVAGAALAGPAIGAGLAALGARGISRGLLGAKMDQAANAQKVGGKMYETRAVDQIGRVVDGHQSLQEKVANDKLEYYDDLVGPDSVTDAFKERSEENRSRNRRRLGASAVLGAAGGAVGAAIGGTLPRINLPNWDLNPFNNGSGGSEGPKNPDYSSFKIGTIEAKTSTEYVQGIFDKLESQGVQTDGLTPEKAEAIARAMHDQGFQMQSGEQTGNTGNFVRVPGVEDKTTNAYASAEQAILSQEDLAKIAEQQGIDPSEVKGSLADIIKLAQANGVEISLPKSN